MAQNFCGPDGLPFSPQRDLAYLYPEACREAFQLLDQVNWPAYFKGWLDAANLTEDDLAEGVAKFCDAHKLFVGDQEIQTPADAFIRSGFLQLPHPVRVLIFEVLGEVLMGGFFVALRDITIRGSIPPQSRSLAEMTAAGLALSRRLHGNPPPNIERLTPELAEEYGQRLDQCRLQLEQLQVRLQTSTTLAEMQSPTIEFFTKLCQQPWHLRLWSVLRLWWSKDLPKG